MITPWASTTIGWRHPNSRMEAATLSIACCGILRAFRPYGMIFSSGHNTTFIDHLKTVGKLGYHRNALVPSHLRPRAHPGQTDDRWDLDIFLHGRKSEHQRF